MLVSATKLMTIEEAEARRNTVWNYELVRGEFRPLMPNGSEHSEVGVNFVFEMQAYVREHALGRVYGSDGGLILSRNPDTLRAPGASFVRAERVPPRAERKGFFSGAPDLAVEVVSPSTTTREIVEKVEIYLSAGVRLVWVADPVTRSITIHRPQQEMRTIGPDDELDGEDVLPGFRIVVATLFE
jgi:Uma2 family endonuclease